MERRRFLTAVGTGATAILAGCGSNSGGPGTDSGGASGVPTNTSPSEGLGMNVPDHEAAAGIRDQPRLGNFEGHTVVAFEDPSCPRCRAFELEVVPEVRSKLVDPGKATFVARNYPVIYPWGKPASQALEATFARDSDAFWALWAFYFEEQSSLSTGNVLDRTASFLDSETALDGAAVRADASEKTYDSAVQTDLDAGRSAGAGGVTPSVFLFRDGEYVTKAQGSVSYNVISTALGE